jgi:1,4-alpha-glucan branching enzyme
MKFLNNFIILFVFTHCLLNAQTITLTPATPTAEQPVTITLDVAGTTLAGEAKIYLHSGVVTTNTGTPGGGDWKFVKGNWGMDDGVGLMTKVTGQTNQWQIVLTPTLRQYYGVPSGTNIFWLAMVFRNANGSKQTSPDIFKPLASVPFVSITSPTNSETFYPAGGSITISGSASAQASSMEILVDEGSGFISKASATNTTSISTSYLPSGGSASIKIKALINSTPVESIADFTFQERPANIEVSLPPGIRDGINYGSDLTKATLTLLAPGKDFVYVVGDFTNWELNNNYFMKRTPDGERFWLEISGLIPGKEYIFQYWVDGTIKIGDPLADKVADPFNDSSIPSSTYPDLLPYNKTQFGVASVLQTNQTPYQWLPSEQNWIAPNKKELVIYEVLLRDFIGSRKYKDLADSLSYFKRLGINAIELMPVMEFEGNLSWGYNPSYFFAPDKFYGTKNDLKDLIQKAHQQGIAVILDMVLNHAFGQNAMVQMYFNKATNKPASNSPWFNVDATHPYNVGYDFNHESQYTKNFVDTVCSYWLAEYHFDGFRFDLSKGFTQKNNQSNVGEWGAYDATRISILTRMANKIWERKPNAYVILEHFADVPEEQTLANAGMLLWGNMTGTYSSALEGNNNSNLRDANRLTYVNYMESHDEERQLVNLLKNGQSNGSYNIKELAVALNRAKMGAAFFYTLPGPKMLWQFGELGYDKSINFCTNGTENNNCRLDNKPLPWGSGSLNYYSDSDRQRLYSTISAINKLVRSNKAVFKEGVIDINPTGNSRSIKITAPDMDVVIIGNFSVSYQSVNMSFTKAGTWYDYFGNESVTVAALEQPLFMAPGEFHIYTSVQQPSPSSGLVDFLVTAIKEKTNNNFTIYPNPVSNKSLVVAWDEKPTSLVTIDLFDLLGRKLNHSQYTLSTSNLEYDVEALSSGVYLLMIEQQGHKKIQKIIIN